MLVVVAWWPGGNVWSPVVDAVEWDRLVVVESVEVVVYKDMAKRTASR